MAHDPALERLAAMLANTQAQRVAQQGFALNTPPEFSAPVSPRSIGGQSLNGKFMFPLSNKPLHPPAPWPTSSPYFGALPPEDATAAQRGTPYAPPEVAAATARPGPTPAPVQAATANPPMVQPPAPAPAVAQLQAVIPDISSSSAGPEYAGPMSSPRPGNLQPAGMDQMGLAEQLLARQQIANALNNPNGSFKSLFGLGG